MSKSAQINPNTFKNINSLRVYKASIDVTTHYSLVLITIFNANLLNLQSSSTNVCRFTKVLILRSSKKEIKLTYSLGTMKLL